MHQADDTSTSLTLDTVLDTRLDAADTSDWPANSRETWALDKLIPYARNARTHSVEQVRQLAASMKEWGFTIPVLVDENGQIIAGHGRVMAAKLHVDEGDSRFERVPVMIARGWSDAKRRAYVIADNKLAENASWDLELLTLELQELDTGEIDLSLLGFDETELRDLLTEDTSTSGGDEAGDISNGPYTFDAMIEHAFAHYRASGFPYPNLPLHESLVEINRLKSAETSTLANSLIAYHVADAYHFERFSTQIVGKVSPLQAFNDDEKLKIALKLCLEMSARLNDSALRGALSFVRGAQCAAQFRPAFALSLIKRFCPDGGVWLDTSAGWGGRLVAFAASHASKYIGIDPSTNAIDGNTRMVHDLQIADRVTLIKSPAEDVDADTIGRDSCDFAFTSPPYFCKERYSDEKTQSFMRYPEARAWRDGFLQPTLALQFACLKSGAYSIVNIADVKIRETEYPLEEWATTCAQAVGFEHVRTEKFQLSRTPGRGEQRESFEPVIVLRKP